MKFYRALLTHAFYTIKLEHDGAGLPTTFLSALMLVSAYMVLAMLNNFLAGELGGNFLFALGLIACIYLFVLRTTLIGLILLIGIVSNSVTLLLSLFGALEAWQMVMVAALEYTMVFGAITNVIKSHLKVN